MHGSIKILWCEEECHNAPRIEIIPLLSPVGGLFLFWDLWVSPTYLLFTLKVKSKDYGLECWKQKRQSRLWSSR